MTGGPAIVAEGLHKRFGAVHALDDVSLTVPVGTILGLLGPNGAGKTTIVKILTTLLRPDAGSARVAAFDVVTQAGQVRSVVGLAGQQAAVDPLLTGRENLDLIATLHHLGRREARRRVRELLERFDLTDAADRRASTYSGGMRRRLDLAASLIGRPQVLVLDEPTAGLDLASRQALWATIQLLVDQGTTALLTTQYLDEADQLADDIAVIDHGQLVAQGTPDQLKAQVGGHRIELQLANPFDASTAVGALEDIAGGSPPLIDPLTGRLVVPITGGAAPTAEVIRALDTAGIHVADLAVRRPTLDDVFLTFTGAPTTIDQADPVAVGGGAS
ncbi:MAG TPA: ATP-binding cassette domain-containing protein [Jiangellaceae bacterium]